MSGLITPTLERLPHASAGQGEVFDRSVELFQLAEAVFDQPDTLLTAVEERANLFEKKVEHAEDSRITLRVRAQKAVRISYGTKLLFAQIGVIEPVGEMHMVIERRLIKAYDFLHDPYVTAIAEIYRTHLRAG